MKDKLLQIRVDDEFMTKMEYLCKIYGANNISDIIRWIILKEYRKEIESEEMFKVIPIEDDDSSYDDGDCGSLCFQIDNSGRFDGFYFGIQGDGWDRYGNPLVPDECNYCIPLPWDVINRNVAKKCKEIEK